MVFLLLVEQVNGIISSITNPVMDSVCEPDCFGGPECQIFYTTILLVSKNHTSLQTSPELMSLKNIYIYFLLRCLFQMNIFT